MSVVESVSTSATRSLSAVALSAPALSAVESVTASFDWTVSAAGFVPESAVPASSTGGVVRLAGAPVSASVTSALSDGASRYHSPTASAAATMKMESLPRIVRTPG